MAALTKDAFAKLLIDRIHQAGEKDNIIYDPEAFELRGEGKRAVVMLLTNAYAEHCSAGEENCDKVLKLWTRTWFNFLRDVPEDFEDAKPDLLPVVRSRSHFELTSLRAEVEGNTFSWPYQIFGEHFGIGLVYDLPDSMRSIPQTNLDAWGVTFYEALEITKENLLTLPSKFIGPASGEGLYLSATGDSYDSSRLIITDLIRRFRVKGDPVAMIPNRDNLIVAGSEDVDGLSGMLNMATEALKKPRPVSGIALRLDGDEWTPWLPDVAHPLYQGFQQLQLQTFGQDYAQQHDLLDELNVKNGEDVFVAKFSVVQAPDGRFFSYATWTDTTNSLLPKTDVLVLGRIGGKPAMVEWQKVADVVGDMLEAEDVYPPRYRVRAFPSGKQLAAMGSIFP